MVQLDLPSNLHISLREFRSGSRLFKEAFTVSSLPQFGHVFIASLNSGPVSFDETLSDRITLRRFSLISRGLGSGLILQSIKYVEFCIRLFVFYKDKRVSMVNVHSLALLPLGVFLKWAFKAKLIYDAHELETEVHGAKGIRKVGGKWIESILVKRADHVFVVSESISDWYSSTYRISRPTVVLNAPYSRKVSKSNYFREKYGLRGDQLILLYQGGLAYGRGVDLILSAFRERSDDKAVIIFMGYGPLEDAISEASRACSNIFFHCAVPSEALLEYTSSADIGIHSIRNTCLNHDFCMPNKLFEYVMAGLPVLVSGMRDMSDFVYTHKIGVVFEEESIVCLNAAVDKLLEMDLGLFSRNARIASVHGSWEAQEAKMLHVYEALLAAR